MRKLSLTIIIGAIMMLAPIITIGQDTPQAYWVHEDVVKPSMVGEYEKICQEVITSLKENNIQDEKWIAASTADSRYMYVSAIDNMATLDKPMLGSLVESIGKESVMEMFNRMDKCYDVEHDYIVVLDNDLSYMPDGITQTPEGQDYRKWHYLHVAPGNRAVVKEKMQAIKDLFAAKGSKVHYRVYRSGFGTRGEFYLVSVAAKNSVDYAERATENDALLGEEGKQLFGELWGTLLKYEEIVGSMRPDLGYTPESM